jgi:hypothetical protein
MVVNMLAISTGASAQTASESIDRALAAAPRQMREAATVIKCTGTANLDRVTQNRKFEAMSDKAQRQTALDAAEANGTRVKPEYGSVWLDMNGPDQAGATAQTTGLPDSPGKGGAWIMNAGS